MKIFFEAMDIDMKGYITIRSLETFIIDVKTNTNAKSSSATDSNGKKLQVSTSSSSSA